MHYLPHIFSRNFGNSIRLFIITSQLCKDLIKGNADRNSQSKLVFDIAPDAFGNRESAAEKTTASRHVKPGFIDPERLDAIRLALINTVQLARVFDVLIIVRR